MVHVMQVMSCNLLPLFSFSFLFPPPPPLPTSFLLPPSLSRLSSPSFPLLSSLPSPPLPPFPPFPSPSSPFFLPSPLLHLLRPGLVSSRENYSPSLWSDENPETNAHPPTSLLVKTGTSEEGLSEHTFHLSMFHLSMFHLNMFHLSMFHLSTHSI